MKSETTGVLLLNLGGPDSIQAVKPFLYNLFSDRQIIRLGPSFLQKPLAKLISSTRSKKTVKYYNLIGGKSPILEITTAQAKALEEALNSKRETENLRHSELRTLASASRLGRPNSRLGESPEATELPFRVFTGMRYWHPFIEDVIPLMYKQSIRNIIALSLYPQYSVATSGSSFTKLDEVSAGFNMKVIRIESWHNHPLYIEALVDVIKKGLASFSSTIGPLTLDPGPYSFVHVLFSAHSLPKKIIEAGDPYEKQTVATINAITEKLDIKWSLSYQSKSGPVKWLEPSTEEKLRELAAKGIKNVLIVPISFVSDHVETLYEIDILYKDFAEKLGINLKRAESLNNHPLFISALKDIVLKACERLK